MRINGEKLTGGQHGRLREALGRAYNLRDFRRMLFERLDKKLDDIIIPERVSFLDVIDKVLEQADEESWTAQLLQAAIDVRPEEDELRTFANPVADTSHLLEMERTIRKDNPNYDVNGIVTNLLQLSACVCHIEDFAGRHLGTGFLVGPDLVMTNYHVWKEAKSPEDFICRFDYKGIANSQKVNMGTTYGLALEKFEEGDMSENHPYEFSLGGKDVVPALDQLDYALLWLDGAPGIEEIRRDNEEGLSKRGWINPHLQEYTFRKDAPLFIIHHPMPHPGMPYYPHRVMKLSMETTAIINTNENKTRVRYKTNTEFGSSGAPCFNAYWELVAIHQSGDPDYKQSHEPQYNQGIPFSTILSLLDKRGKRKLLGKQPDEEQVNTEVFSPADRSSTSYSPVEEKAISSLPRTSPSQSELFAPQSIRQAAIQNDKKAPGISSRGPRSKTRQPVKPKQQKPIDLNEHRKIRAAEKLTSHEEFLKQLSQHFEDAQNYVLDAQAPFAERAYPPGHFQKAIELLEAADASLQSLYKLLYEKSLPEAIAKKRGEIRDRIDTAHEQIRDILIPLLIWDNEGNFSVLCETLSDIYELIFG